jgi:hypothetical protein
VHLTVEIGAWKGRFSGNQRIVVIQKSQSIGCIERFNLRPAPLAKRAGSVHEDVVLCLLSHSAASRIQDYYGTAGRHMSGWEIEMRNYRNRPGGSADGGMCGVEDGAPEFADTLEGAGCGSPMPTFIS